ncbi:MAG: hypothetical protein GTO13_13650 [Proteobacteria bacterium]|nr:hypothetical protein [Pseudomonadota bacterium]
MGKRETRDPDEENSHWSFVASYGGSQGDVKEKIEQKPKGPEGLPINDPLLKPLEQMLKNFCWPFLMKLNCHKSDI